MCAMPICLIIWLSYILTLYAFQLSDNLFSSSFPIPTSSPPSHSLFFVCNAMPGCRGAPSPLLCPYI